MLRQAPLALGAFDGRHCRRWRASGVAVGRRYEISAITLALPLGVWAFGISGVGQWRAFRRASLAFFTGAFVHYPLILVFSKYWPLCNTLRRLVALCEAALIRLVVFDQAFTEDVCCIFRVRRARLLHSGDYLEKTD